MSTKKKNELEELLNVITVTAKEASVNIDELPGPVRGGWTTRVAEARNALASLKNNYKAAALQNALGVFVSGPADKVKAYTDLVTAEREGIAINSQELFQVLTDEVEPQFGPSRQWSIDQSYRLRGAIHRALDGLGIAEIMAPDTSSPAPMPDTVATQKYIRDIIRAANGDDLNVLYLMHHVGERALAMGLSTTPVPVFMTDVPEAETQSLGKVFGTGTVLNLNLQESDEITKEFLNKSFQELVKTAKSNAKNSK